MLHIATEVAWADAQRSGVYALPGGVVHGCRAPQLELVVGAHFPEAAGHVVLEVADAKTDGTVHLVVCEQGGRTEVFPHLHGHVPLDAVIGVRSLADALASTRRGRPDQRSSGEIVGAFIDAAAQDPERASAMLRETPGLLEGSWMGGETPLHFCAIEAHAEAVRFLAAAGADVDPIDGSGATPLLCASLLGDCEVAAVLLEFGADPNAASATVGSVLHAAVQSGSAPLVALLLDAGANPRVVDDLGETPFDALADDDPTERSAILAVLRSRRISPSRG